jgi:hypothetical protein
VVKTNCPVQQWEAAAGMIVAAFSILVIPLVARYGDMIRAEFPTFCAHTRKLCPLRARPIVRFCEQLFYVPIVSLCKAISSETVFKKEALPNQ